MNNSVKVYTMIEDMKMSFPEVAAQLGGLTIKEVGYLWAVASEARKRSLERPVVVYRKRRTTSTSHHKTLSRKMKSLK